MLFEALRPFQAEQPVNPGDVLDSQDWPHGRAEKLVDQRYIRPLTAVDPEAVNEAVRRAAAAEARVAELEGVLAQLKTKLRTRKTRRKGVRRG